MRNQGEIKMVKVLILSLLLVAATSAIASNDSVKTICNQDERVLSYNPRVARILKVGGAAGCTVTLIGKSCAVSAGHCTSTFQIAEFNTPASRGGKIVNSKPIDTYRVNQGSIKFKSGGQGNDWAVLRLDKNKISGKYPGELQGHYDISTSFKPTKGDLITITGYGRDSADPIRNFAQQTNSGPIRSVSSGIIRHRADTMGGNSGSSIIHASSKQIIGIHTHGGCSRSGDTSSNASTLVAGNTQFSNAIVACLKYEDQNL
jgi:V8-like Glu-specific endopeptidase